MKKITSILASFLMLFGMGLQAAPADQPEVSTKDAPKWYTVKSYRSGNYLTATNGKVEHLAGVTDSTLWYFVESGEGVALVNGATGTKLNHDFTIGETDATWFVLPNGVNGEGLSISKTSPISGGSCMDAANHNSSVGTWQPSAGDWQGTTWVIESCSESIKSAIASMDSKFMGTMEADAQTKAQWEKYLTSNTAADYVKFFQEVATAKVKMPVEGKTYFVKSAYAEYMNKQGVEKALFDEGEKPMWKTLNNTDKAFYWKVVPQGDGYTFQNESTGKYIKALDATSAVAEEAVAIKMESLGNNKFKLNLNGAAMHTNGHSNGNGQEGNIVSWWGTPWGSSDWYVEEAVWSAAVDVVFDYYVDGVKVASSDPVKVKEGEQLVCPLQSNTYVTYEVEAGVAAQGMHAKVNCIEHLPFAKSANLEKANWFVVDIHSNEAAYYLTTDGTKPYVEKMASREDVSMIGNDNYYWSFVGNVVTGFQIYNKATQKALTNTPDFVTFAEADAPSWKLVKSTQVEGATAFTVDGTNYMNKQKVGEVFELKYWSQPDAGSSCRFFTDQQLNEMVVEVKANALIAAAKAVPATPAGYVGTSLYLADSVNAKAFAAALAALEANKKDAAAFSALQAQYEKAGQLIEVVDGGLYRIKNYSRNLSVGNGNLEVGQGAFLSNTYYPTAMSGDKKVCSQISVGTTSMADAGAVWQLVKSENGYMFKNVNTGKYIAKSDSLVDNHAALVGADAAGAYEVVKGAYAASFKLVNGGKHLHASTNGAMFYPENGPSDWYLIPATELEVSMNKAEGAAESWSSLYLPFGVKMVEGVEAFAGKVNGNVMNLTAVGEVPANYGVILKGSADKYVLPIFAEATAAAENELTGTNVESPVVAGALVLGNGAQGVGMYNPAGEVMKANKAYVDAPAAINGLKFVFGEATGVEGVEVETESAVYYDLSGRRVANPVKGIYVKNGKKVYVK